MAAVACSPGPASKSAGTSRDVTWQAFWKTAIDGQPGKQAAGDLGLSVAAVYIARSRSWPGSRNWSSPCKNLDPSSPGARQAERKRRDSMPAPRDCPNGDVCGPWIPGPLQPDQREQYERHLESCPVCQELLDQADRCEEELIQAVPAVRRSDGGAARPDPGRGRGRLYAMKSAPATGAVEPADLSFLRPAEPAGTPGDPGRFRGTGSDRPGRHGGGPQGPRASPAPGCRHQGPLASPGQQSHRARRFTRETQAAAAVSHDYIVPIHAVHETEGLPYLVMQYVAGESLQVRLERGGPPPVEEVVGIGLQTALGLAAAHAQGLIHRDIKPANLLLERGAGNVRLPGWPGQNHRLRNRLHGRGHPADSERGHRRHPGIHVPGASPRRAIDHRTDLFSLGSVLYALCTGDPPFRGSTTVAVLRQVSDETPAPVRVLGTRTFPPGWRHSSTGCWPKTRLTASRARPRLPACSTVTSPTCASRGQFRSPGSPLEARVALA